jgi:DNA polymerase III alpha subunit|tara:strand:- start:1318 stop:1464 length:147 start_codon:yes stop_codon:yes gene_type:complete
MDVNEKNLLKIKKEMENVRELFIKGYIDKNLYQKETRTLFEIAVKYGA